MNRLVCATAFCAVVFAAPTRGRAEVPSWFTKALAERVVGWEAARGHGLGRELMQIATEPNPLGLLQMLVPQPPRRPYPHPYQSMPSEQDKAHQKVCVIARADGPEEAHALGCDALDDEQRERNE